MKLAGPMWQMLATIALLASAGMAAGATGAPPPPIISIANCTQDCAEFPVNFPPACGKCFLENSDISRWSKSGQFGPLQRLPLFEGGYKKQCAIIMVRNQDRAAAPPTFLATFFNSNFGGLGNMTLCRNGTCVNAPVGSVTAPASNSTCTQVRGWTVPWAAQPGVGGFPQPDCNPNATWTTWNSPLQRIENTVATTLLRGQEIYRPEAMAMTAAALTNVDAAARSIWRVAQAPTGACLFFRNVTDTAHLKTLYGTEYNSTWGKWALAGDLVELDLTSIEGFSPTKGRWTPAVHVVMRYEKTAQGAVELVASAVRLSNVNGTAAYKVYTPAKSASAFIMATLVVRAAQNDGIGQVFSGHVYNYHNLQSAATYALVNTIQPDKTIGNATHPVRQALDPFLDPKVLGGFNALLIPGRTTPPPNTVSLHSFTHVAELFELIATKPSPLGGPSNFWTTTVDSQLRLGRLHPARFTSSTPWDLFPLAGFLKTISDKATAYTTAVVNEFYVNDAAVASDAAIQDWVAFMLRPDGANLGQLNAANEIKTRKQLAWVMGQLVFKSLAHGVTQLPEYLNHLSAVAMWPMATELTALPDPSRMYSTEDIIAAGPGTETVSMSLQFHYSFAALPSATMFVPSTTGKYAGPPAWDAELPYTNDRANAALVAFRRDYAALIFASPVSNLIRSTDTAWGAPTTIPLCVEK